MALSLSKAVVLVFKRSPVHSEQIHLFKVASIPTYHVSFLFHKVSEI